jgi:ribosomal protein S4
MGAYKINRKSPKFDASLRIQKFPWNLSKMIRFKRRKWLKIKFSTRFSTLKKRGNVINFRFFRTYKNKIKKLFKIYFAPKFTDRQCQKLLRLNSRYKATFQKLLQIESRADTLVFRLYMISNVALARELIKKNYFLFNGKAITSPTMILNVGDILSTSNIFAWQFLYQNMLKTISSLLKYFSRLFFKFSFPFIIKRKNFHLKEYGKFKKRVLKFLNPTVSNRLTTRNLFLRYKKIKETTTSKIKPAKKYYFTDQRANGAWKLKRLKSYILKKTKTNLRVITTLAIAKKLRTFTIQKHFFKNEKKLLRQLGFLKKVTSAAKPSIDLLHNLSAPKMRHRKRRAILANFKAESKNRHRITKKVLKYFLSKMNRLRGRKSIPAIKKKKNMFFKKRLKKKKNKIRMAIRKLPFLARPLPNLTGSLLAIELLSKAKNLVKVGKKIIFKKVSLSANHKRKLVKAALSVPASKGKVAARLPVLPVVPGVNKKLTHFKFLFTQKSSYFCLKSRRPKKPTWRRWVPKKAKNFWQLNRITKKNLYLFRYLKKFNNKYKQYSYFQKLRSQKFVILKHQTAWQKTSLLLEKKKKKLLTCQLAKSIVFEKKNIKSLFIYKNYTFRTKRLKGISKSSLLLRVKRKFLRLKGFFRQYKNFKINVQFAEQNQIYAPIFIQYKKINLLFKNRPIAYYFVEANYNDLEFTIVADVDFLFFPYKFYCNQ